MRELAAENAIKIKNNERMYKMNIQSASIRIMSFNVLYDYGEDKPFSWLSRKTLVFSLMQFHSPDVFCLQEPLPCTYHRFCYDRMTKKQKICGRPRFMRHNFRNGREQSAEAHSRHQRNGAVIACLRKIKIYKKHPSGLPPLVLYFHVGCA